VLGLSPFYPSPLPAHNMPDTQRVSRYQLVKEWTCTALLGGQAGDTGRLLGARTGMVLLSPLCL
jgi:hypothetical protein